MKTNIEERACDLAVYIIENKATVRAAAHKFGISKSTVHKDLSERLEHNLPLYRQVKDVLEQNKPSAISVAVRLLEESINAKNKQKNKRGRGCRSRIFCVLAGTGTAKRFFVICCKLLLLNCVV